MASSTVTAVSTSKDLASLRIQRDGRGLRRRRRIPWGLLFLLVCLGAGAAWWFWPRPPLVRLGTVALTHPSQTLAALTASGYMVADRKSSVAAKITSQLVWLGVEEGQLVRQGDILARLEAEDLAAAHAAALAEVVAAEARLKQLEAELLDTERQERRLQALVRTGAIAQSEYDAAETRRDVARAAIFQVSKQVLAAKAAAERARVDQGYATLRAPFDAVVLTKNADVGDILTPLGAAASARASVVTLADLTSLQAEVDVSESQIGKVAAGMPCEIELDALPGERFPGVVHMIVPTADRTKATILVKVRFNHLDPRVLPDMSVRVSFLSRALAPGEETPRLTAPAEALVWRQERAHVLRYANGTLEQVAVQPGEAFGGLTAIAGELAAGQKVVLSPAEELAGGMPVRVQED
ncbi:efflux RND transporter periplasmic adaptor subunit [Megalodesulfovibrio gigas]|uniref:Putative secretion protein HlyD family protein n=2 Tax=Megalodesulfovibrio gigas TaxID=879 RepID=T2GFJ4_MEGG1|nr:efflux RND transporter periplasmic adaptor subunit [Megalodesulfovibrio gigas]AGW14672.1 putative secretion protein HlyD family protein [Megalodesulfovibrio gigas DSM 1382 = ATCC 19364]